MPSLITVGYVWQILGMLGQKAPCPIPEQPQKSPSWIGLTCKSFYMQNGCESINAGIFLFHSIEISFEEIYWRILWEWYIEATSKIGKTCLQCSKKSRWLRAFKTLSREWFNTKVSEFQSWKQQSSLFKFILLVPVFVTKRGNSKQSFYISEAKERIWSSKSSYLIKGINIRFCTCFVLVSCWKSLVKLGMHIIRNSITWN